MFTWLRKRHEVWLTLIMEQQLSKRRILELYLNITEFAPGIHGVEAAANSAHNRQSNSLPLF